MTTEVEGQLHAIPKPAPSKPRWRKAFVASSALVAMLMVSVGFLPPLLLQTSLRNKIIGKPFAESPMTASASGASGGWFTPLIFNDVRISDADGQIVCTIRELRTTKGMLGFLTDADDVGRITLVEPKVEINVAEDGTWPEFQSKPSKAQLNYEIQDGSVVVTVPWRKLPIVDLANLDITGRVGLGADGKRSLFVDATQVLDRESISEQHTEQNLALIAPILSQSTTIAGSASVWLDAIEFPLEEPAQAPALIRGRAEFHSLEARLKEDWVRQMAAVTGALTQNSLPDRVEVIKDSEVQFVISEEGITHEGMVFLLPDIAKELTVSSSGTIRLDESLDLKLTVRVPKIIPADKPMLSLLSQLTAEPLQLIVKGTVSQPKLQMPTGLASSLLNSITATQHETTAPAVPDAIAGMLQSVSNPNKEQAGQQLTGSIFNLIKAIDHNAKEKAKATPAKPKKRRNKQ